MTELLNGKTRKELAALIGIAYMNEHGKDKAAGKRVMKGWLRGTGAVKAQSKEAMVAAVARAIEKGFVKNA